MDPMVKPLGLWGEGSGGIRIMGEGTGDGWFGNPPGQGQGWKVCLRKVSLGDQGSVDLT